MGDPVVSAAAAVVDAGAESALSPHPANTRKFDSVSAHTNEILRALRENIRILLYKSIGLLNKYAWIQMETWNLQKSVHTLMDRFDGLDDLLDIVVDRTAAGVHIR